MRLGPIKAIDSRAYSSGERIRATTIMPRADMTDEAARPQNRLNPPLAETFPRFLALLSETRSPERIPEMV